MMGRFGRSWLKYDLQRRPRAAIAHEPMALPPVTTHEFSRPFGGLEEWLAFVQATPWAYDHNFVAALVSHVQKNGVSSLWHGTTPADQVEVAHDNYRETVAARQCTVRVRAMLDALLSATRGDTWRKVLLFEALTPFAREVRGRYSLSLAVEYLPTEAERERMFPISHCDMCDMSFQSGSFDVLVSNDVLEHVPDLEKALAESFRVLKPGGWMLATFPFLFNQPNTLRRARLQAGELVHLIQPPEYHGNPVAGSANSLVFNVPGWDIIALCGRIGFQASMTFQSSGPRGIVSKEVAGVHFLTAQKPG